MPTCRCRRVAAAAAGGEAQAQRDCDAAGESELENVGSVSVSVPYRSWITMLSFFSSTAKMAEQHSEDAGFRNWMSV